MAFFWLLAQQTLPRLPEGDATKVAWIAAGFVVALVVLALTIALGFRKAEKSLVRLVEKMILDANASVIEELDELNSTAKKTNEELSRLILSVDRHDGRVRRIEERLDRIEKVAELSGEKVIRHEGRMDSFERRLEELRR